MAKKKKIISQHSGYWLSKDLFDADAEKDETGNLERVMRLSVARRAIANFVNILTNRNDIPVKLSSGQQSYTDGKSVVIAADDNPNNFDSMVGLALHEAAHVLLTDFKPLRAVHKCRESVVHHLLPMVNDQTKRDDMHLIFHPAISSILPWWDDEVVEKYCGNRWEVCRTDEWRELPIWNALTKVLDDLHTIGNIIEDRRIDKYVYQNASGYRPYYNALYNRYFFTDEAGKNLKFNPEWRELTVDNYINRLLYSFHPDSDLDALPGLRQIVELIDLNTIERIAPSPDALASEHEFSLLTFSEMPKVWQLSNEVYAHILKFVTFSAAQRNDSSVMVLPCIPSENVLDELSQLPNLDGEPTSFEPTDVEDNRGKPGKFDAEKAARELAKAKDALYGNVKKKKATKAEEEAAKALESAAAKLEDIGGHGVPKGARCMVTRRLSDAMFEQEWFMFKRWDWKEPNPLSGQEKIVQASIATGKRLGAILAQRLQVRNDPLMTKFSRLPNGAMDKRLLAQLGMDNVNIFHKSQVDSHRPALLFLSIDASGSMNGPKFEKVRSLMVALAYVGSKLRNVDSVISLRGGNDMPMVNVVFDSRRDQFATFLRYVRRFEAGGGTPEGLCFAATMNMILESADTHDVYFINFSDGEPSFAVNANAKMGKRRGYSPESWMGYHGEVAFNHTRQMIQMMRERGVKILSYFISDYRAWQGRNNSSEEAFKKMYGEDASFVNVESAGEVLRTLNRLLLARA